MLTLGICIYETLFPIWYFQGIEQMKYITYINVISRGAFTALIFLLIKTQADYLLVPALNMIGALIAGAISIYLLFYKHKINFKIPMLNVLWQFTKESAPFFFSRATGVVIARSNTVLIGSFMGYAEVAYYDLAIKISELCKIPSNLINQTIFPRISVTKDMNMVVQIIKYNFVLSVFIYVSVFILINPIINILGGLEMLPAKYVILLLNITTPLAGISYFLGNTMLVVNGYFKEFNRSVIFEALLYSILAFLIIITKNQNLFTFVGIIIVSGLFEVGYRYYYIKHYKII
jgi:PST family polysaccharide transporter